MAWVAPWPCEDSHPGISWILMEGEETKGDWPQYLCPLLVLPSLFSFLLFGHPRISNRDSAMAAFGFSLSTYAPCPVAVGRSHEQKLRGKEGQWASCLMPTGLFFREEKDVHGFFSLRHHFLIYSEVAGPPGIWEMFHKWLHPLCYFLSFFPFQNTFSFAQPSPKILTQGLVWYCSAKDSVKRSP